MQASQIRKAKTTILNLPKTVITSKIPDYSSMPISNLKKLANSYGLKTNLGKRFLVEKLTDIWKAINLDKPISIERSAGKESFDDLLKVAFKKDVNLNQKIVCFEVKLY